MASKVWRKCPQGYPKASPPEINNKKLTSVKRKPGHQKTTDGFEILATKIVLCQKSFLRRKTPQVPVDQLLFPQVSLIHLKPWPRCPWSVIKLLCLHQSHTHRENSPNSTTPIRDSIKTSKNRSCKISSLQSEHSIRTHCRNNGNGSIGEKGVPYSNPCPFR